ncbi:hypothetical protein EJ05DRAFT_199531 [Pseudovirgaria hyperparasitica]|uniref:Uncharacterized protein n=1 Tax=Pseudovirgaria hyperparasitica TaxID=470096 RepID=A0A6A6WH80_9PEZI|nr:uncharacterized protein EJ05DRAFT_199531 [Pseudovirgaria hyperparasitica]KAF2762163.1 hypothetical protein EJ05DRAFT_199531 [Pseudovirgaria hyperparasitica]
MKSLLSSELAGLALNSQGTSHDQERTESTAISAKIKPKNSSPKTSWIVGFTSKEALVFASSTIEAWNQHSKHTSLHLLLTRRWPHTCVCAILHFVQASIQTKQGNVSLALGSGEVYVL